MVIAEETFCLYPMSSRTTMNVDVARKGVSIPKYSSLDSDLSSAVSIGPVATGFK